jgi:hypothetical protein
VISTATPQAGDLGPDSFTYRDTHGALSSAPIAVTLQVQAVNYLPVTRR